MVYHNRLSLNRVLSSDQSVKHSPQKLVRLWNWAVAVQCRFLCIIPSQLYCINSHYLWWSLSHNALLFIVSGLCSGSSSAQLVSNFRCFFRAVCLISRQKEKEWSTSCKHKLTSNVYADVFIDAWDHECLTSDICINQHKHSPLTFCSRLWMCFPVSHYKVYWSVSPGVSVSGSVWHDGEICNWLCSFSGDLPCRLQKHDPTLAQIF